MHRPGEGVFGRGSNVLEYWLANSEGFTIAKPAGRRRVATVVIDPETRQALSLVVRRSRRRTQVVAADSITAVDPHGRVLYLAQRRRHRASRPRPKGNAWITAAPALQAMRATRAYATSGAHTGARLAARGTRVAGRHARSGAQTGAKLAARGTRVAGTHAQSGAGLAARRTRTAAAVARIHTTSGAAVLRGHTRSVLAKLGPLLAAYAHNAAIVARAYLRAAEARLRDPWTLSSPPSWTRRAPRSLAARSRMPGHLRRASKRFRGMSVPWRS